jgi:hypothetical protein
MSAAPAVATGDLRRATLTALRRIDFRAATRDLWADESALWDRLLVSWAGLDEAAWRLPGAARSDAGGPDWSLAEHVGHLADWQELAIDYVAIAEATGRWPSDDDFDGGDFDRFNERRRAPWTTMASGEIIDRLMAARPRLLGAVHRFTVEELRGDASWGWMYMTLHGHYLDHLGVIEPWADDLRVRQVDGDPFRIDPRVASHAEFATEAAAVVARFESMIEAVPIDRWDADDVTPGWTLRDHVGHLADWATEGVRAVDIFGRDGRWIADPDEGIDPWNARHVAAARDESASDTRGRYDQAYARLLTAVMTLPLEAVRSPDGWSWAYDCLYGHVRKHLAMLGPWCARIDWPAGT